MGDRRTAEEDDRLATFVMLYQEPVGSQGRATSSTNTHTLAREEVDHLGTRTDTGARESDDASALAHVTFPAEALTKTGVREQEDADLSAAFTVIPRGIETQTDSRDAREHTDTDISQGIFMTFPPRA